MAHCCDGCVYERPGGQCAREDTYLEEHNNIGPAKIIAIVAIVALIAIISIAVF